MEHADKKEKITNGYSYTVNLYGNWAKGKNVYYYGDEIKGVALKDVVSGEITSVEVDGTDIGSLDEGDTLMKVCNKKGVKDEEVKEKSVEVNIKIKKLIFSKKVLDICVPL